MNTADLDRLDELAAHMTPGKVAIDRCSTDHDLLDGFGAWLAEFRSEYDRDVFIASRTAIPALVAEVRRLRRGVEHWPCSSCGGRGVYPRRKCPYCNATGLDERAGNLLAGREWNDNGTTAAMPRKGSDNGV